MTIRQHEQCRDVPGMFDAFQRARHKPPGCGQKIVNAGQAVRRAATAAVSGKQVVADAATVAARKVICNTCPERDKRDVCRECGCALSAKQRLLTETCPLGLWPTPDQSPA